MFFIRYTANNSNYPHLLPQGLFKGCPAHLSYLNTESGCLVYAYIILKATDPNTKFFSLQEHHEGGGSTSSLYPDLPLTFMQKKTFIWYSDSNYFHFMTH